MFGDVSSVRLLIFWLLGAVAPLYATRPEGLPVLQVYPLPQEGLGSGAWCTTQDATGRIYVGCDGVFSFDGERWRPHAMPAAFAVRALDFGPDGRLWVGAINQLGWFDPAPDGIGVYHSLTDRLPFPAAELGDVWHVFAEGNEAVFITNQRILRWDGTRFSVLDGPSGDSRRLMAFRMEGRLYVSHRTAGLFEVERTGLRPVADPNPLAGNPVIWGKQTAAPPRILVTSRGLMQLVDGQVTRLGDGSYLSSHGVSGAAALSDGGIAVATVLGGIVLYNADGSLRRLYDLSDGLPTRQIYSLFVDRAGSIWATSARSVIRIDLAQGQTVFDSRTGLAASEVRDLAVHEGSLVAAAGNTLWSLQPRPGEAARFAPLPYEGQPILSLAETTDGLAIGRSTRLELLQAGQLRDLKEEWGDAHGLSPSASGDGFVVAFAYRLLRYRGRLQRCLQLRDQPIHLSLQPKD